jgi:hypothetical protein
MAGLGIIDRAGRQLTNTDDFEGIANSLNGNTDMFEYRPNVVAPVEQFLNPYANQLNKYDVISNNSLQQRLANMSQSQLPIQAQAPLPIANDAMYLYSGHAWDN